MRTCVEVGDGLGRELGTGGYQLLKRLLIQSVSRRRCHREV